MYEGQQPTNTSQRSYAMEGVPYVSLPHGYAIANTADRDLHVVLLYARDLRANAVRVEEYWTHAIANILDSNIMSNYDASFCALVAKACMCNPANATQSLTLTLTLTLTLDDVRPSTPFPSCLRAVRTGTTMGTQVAWKFVASAGSCA